MKKVSLPVKARDARRIASYLMPEEKDGILLLVVCKDLSCVTCVFHRKPDIVFGRVKIRDPLSGLKLSVPIVKMVYCGRTVWSAIWRKGMLWVDSVNCPAYIRDECLVVKGEIVSCTCNINDIDHIRKVLERECEENVKD